jgi:hypothetical protein
VNAEVWRWLVATGQSDTASRGVGAMIIFRRLPSSRGWKRALDFPVRVIEDLPP